MSTHRRIDRIKAVQKNILEKSKPLKLRKRLIVLGIPLLGIASLIILSLTGILKFQFGLFLERIIHIVGPMICVICMFFLLKARFTSKKHMNYLVKILIWLIFFILLTIALLLVIPDSVLTKIHLNFNFFK